MSSPLSAVNLANVLIPGLSAAPDAFTSSAPVDLVVEYALSNGSSPILAVAGSLPTRAPLFANYDFRCDGRTIRIDFKGHRRPDDEILTKAIIREIVPALGDILVRGKNEEGQDVGWLGSGFSISPDIVRRIGCEIKERCSYLFTNRHVASEKATEIKVKAFNGRLLTAQLLVSDEKYDAALLEVETGVYPIPPVQLVQEGKEKVEQGDSLLAFGQPHGFSLTVTRGMMSGWEKIDEIDMLQTDAPINPGNSGGPLVNFDGRVVGMNSFKPNGAEGIAFAYYIWDQVAALEQAFQLASKKT